MHEDEFRPVVHHWFGRNGFTVTDIPPTNCKTPDFHLASDIEESLVELKIKGDDLDELASDNAVLASGDILERSLPLTPRNRLERIVRDGHEQMMEFDPEKKCFHVLWIHCVGRDSEHLEERFRMTLFGQQRLISTERENVLHALFSKTPPSGVTATAWTV